MINILKITLLVIISITFNSGVYSQELLDLKDQQEVYLTSKYIRIYEDKNDKLSINEILSDSINSQFSPLKAELPVIKDKNTSYWLKFIIQSNLTNQYLVECFTFKINLLEIYTRDKHGIVTRQEASNLTEFGKRIFEHKNFEFPLNLTNEPKIYYIRVKNIEPIRLTLVVRSIQRFAGYAVSEYFLLGLYYGIISVIALYNIFLYLTIREKAHLYYVIYVISVGLYSMGQDGTGFQYLWPEFPFLNKFTTQLFLFSLILWMLMYTKAFLSVPNEMPKINRIIDIYLILRGLYAIVGFFIIPHINNFLFIDLIPFLISYICAYKAYKKGFYPARYFLVGFSLLFMAFFITGLMYAKLIVNNVFTVYAVNIGVVLEMLLLSAALAERVKLFREEKINKEKENIKLEEMVSLRTKELELANEKLKAQSYEIAQMNLLLHADNRKLAEDVKKIAEDRVLQKRMDYDQFQKIYPDDQKCLAYLANLKWEKGYKCVRCENETYLTGKTDFSRRCTKCGYDESASACTIFHGIKFPLTKAFYMMFLVTDNTEITVEQLSEQLELTIKTCWNFKKKISEAMVVQKGKKVKSSTVWGSLILQNPKKIA